MPETTDLSAALRGAAERAVNAACDSDRTIAVAESLTSGLVASLLGSAPGSGTAFHGGAVTYTRDAKARLFRTSPGRVVDEATALDMAAGVRELFGADVSVSLTGVAGPGTQDGRPVGTVCIGWATDAGAQSATIDVDGDPEQIVERSALAALKRLTELLSGP